jgi:hypothetical protein
MPMDRVEYGCVKADGEWIGPRTTEAGNGVWLALLTIWACTVLYLDPPVLALIAAAPNAWFGLMVFAFVGCLNLCWLFAIYYLVMAVAGVAWRKRGRTVDRTPRQLLDRVEEDDVVDNNSGVATSRFPRVVLLYCTRNDFRKKSVGSLLEQDHPGYEVIICDDSTLPECRAQVDDLSIASTASRRIGRVTLGSQMTNSQMRGDKTFG